MFYVPDSRNDETLQHLLFRLIFPESFGRLFCRDFRYKGGLKIETQVSPGLLASAGVIHSNLFSSNWPWLQLPITSGRKETPEFFVERTKNYH